MIFTISNIYYQKQGTHKNGTYTISKRNFQSSQLLNPQTITGLDSWNHKTKRAFYHRVTILLTR
jgi:hypothetical protein